MSHGVLDEKKKGQAENARLKVRGIMHVPSRVRAHVSREVVQISRLSLRVHIGVAKSAYNGKKHRGEVAIKGNVAERSRAIFHKILKHLHKNPVYIINFDIVYNEVYQIKLYYHPIPKQ